VNTPGEPTHLTDEMLQSYWQTLVQSFDAYYSGYARDRMHEVQQWLQRLEVQKPEAVTIRQRLHLLSLQCWYHLLASGLARDQEEVESVTSHADMALHLAEWAITEPALQGSEQALFPLPHALVVAGLLWRADVSYELGEGHQGKADLDRVLTLLPTLHQANAGLRGITSRGILYVQQTPREMERLFLFSCFHLTLQLHAFGVDHTAWLVAGERRTFEHGALLSLWEEASNKPGLRRTDAQLVLGTLMIAQQVTPPALVRLHTVIALFLAACAFAAGEDLQAVDFALGALEKCRVIRSRPYRDRIAALSQQFLRTASRDEPSVADLASKLRTWDDTLN